MADHSAAVDSPGGDHIIDAFDRRLDPAFGFFDNLRNPYDSLDRYEPFADIDGGDDYGPKPKSVKRSPTVAKHSFAPDHYTRVTHRAL